MRKVSGLAAAAWLTIVLAAPAIAKDKHPGGGHHRPPQVDALYSARALRRARTIVQLRMLELREERLDCIRAVLQGRLPREFAGRAASLALRAKDCANLTR